MKILLAGGAGYVGSALVPRLLERGYEISAVDLLWFGNHLPSSVSVLQREILDLDVSDLEGVDQVVFLAGLSNDPMAEYSPARNFIANAAAPAYLAYIAKRAGVRRFVYGGSCSIYGYTQDELYDETRPTVSNYPYGISKLMGEQGVLQLQDGEYSTLCLRKGTICGYSPPMRLDLVVNTMFMTALRDGVIRVNNPSIWRPILAISDAVSAYVRAIECGPDISGVFNIASGNFTVGELADYVAEGVKRYLDRAPRIDILHQEDFRNYKVDIDRARNVLSFKPQNTVVDIVHDLVENRESFSDFDNPAYYNIKTFVQLPTDS